MIREREREREGEGKDHHAITRFYTREYKKSQGLGQTIRQSGDHKKARQTRKIINSVVCSLLVLHFEH
jgi:hypothetical protein